MKKNQLPTPLLVIIAYLTVLTFPLISQATYDDIPKKDVEILAKGEISTIRYLAGGVLSIVPGFGFGHFVQGRYLDDGWKYSLATVLLPTFVLFALVSSNENKSDLDAIGIVGLAATSIFVVKAYEINDAWTAPLRLNKWYRDSKKRYGATKSTSETSKLYLAPLRKGLQAGFSWTY